MLAFHTSRGRGSRVTTAVLKCAGAILLFALPPFELSSAAAAAAPPPEAPMLVIDAGSHTGSINRIAASSSCSRIATASDDKTVRVWSAAGGGEGRFALVQTLRPAYTAGTGPLYAVAMSSDGR